MVLHAIFHRMSTKGRPIIYNYNWPTERNKNIKYNCKKQRSKQRLMTTAQKKQKSKGDIITLAVHRCEAMCS